MCRVSGIVDFCEQVHLVSAGEREQWDTNMGESSDLEIQLALNGMLLGVDLHRSFDAGTWVPMVKEDGRLIVYMVWTADVLNQFAALRHNVKMQKLVGIDRTGVACLHVSRGRCCRFATSFSQFGD